MNTTATTGTFTSNAGKVETTSSCVFWLTGKSGYQEFISERPTADPVKAYIKVKTENIGYGELTKTDESSGVKLSGAGIIPSGLFFYRKGDKQHEKRTDYYN